MMRSLRRLGIPLFLVVICLVSGCKLVVEVGEGGQVVSTSQQRNCPEDTACVFEVTDTKFTDKFTAVPLQGYRFVKWEAGGPELLCGGATNPVCALTNKSFTGIAAIESIIASDATFLIKPIFKMNTAPRFVPRYVVKDSKGAVLGEVTNFSYESVTVRLEYVDEMKTHHGYLLVFDNNSVKPVKSNKLVWNNATCTGNIAYMLIPEPYRFVEPLISNTYQVINESPQDTGVFSLVRISPRESAQQLPKPYAKYGDVCQPWGGSAKGVPATIVVHDLGATFKPPFGLFAQ